MKPARFYGNKKHHFRVGPERCEDSNLSSDGEETDLDQDIISKSNLFCGSPSSSSKSSDDNKGSKTEEEITESHLEVT